MKLQRIAEQAKRYREMVFNNVFHLIDREFLLEAYRQTRKSSAPGVDKVTAKQYADNLDDNLRDLHERLRDNRYVAPPVERVWDREGRWEEEADRETLLRGQDCPASGGDDFGGHLRA